MKLTGTGLTGACRALSIAASVGCQEITVPRPGVQSSTVPIVIFPICKIFLPTRTYYGLRTADSVADSKIAVAAEPVAPEPDRRGGGAMVGPRAPVPAGGRTQPGRNRHFSNAHVILADGR